MNKMFIASVVLMFVTMVSSTIYGVSYYTSYPAFDNPQWTECNIENFSLSTHTMSDCEEASTVIKSDV